MIGEPCCTMNSIKLLHDMIYNHSVMIPIEQVKPYIEKIITINYVYKISTDFYSDPSLSQYVQGVQRFVLELVKEIDPQDEEIKRAVKHSCMKAFTAIACFHSQAFWEGIKRYYACFENHPLLAASILESLKFLVKSSYTDLFYVLVPIVEVVLRCLNPNNIPLRKLCQRESELSFQVLAKMYKAVAFNSSAQKVAVLSPEQRINVYDLRTATLWKVVEAFKVPVSLMGFDEEGKTLVVASFQEKKLFICSLHTDSLLGGFFNQLPPKIKEINCSQFEKLAHEPLEHLHLFYEQRDKKIIIRDQFKCAFVHKVESK